MATLGTVKGRLEWYRRDTEAGCKIGPSGIMDPDSLRRAAEYFGLNPKDTADLISLAHTLADVVFGKPERGRTRGDGNRLIRLALHLHYFEQRVGRLADTALAKELAQMPDYKHQKWESLRKQLPAARRAFEDTQAMFRDFPVEEWAPAFLQSDE